MKGQVMSTQTVPSSSNFDELLRKAKDAQARTRDTQVVSYVEGLRDSSVGLQQLLRSKPDDPTRRLRQHWDEMADAAEKLLKQIDDQQLTRERALQQARTPGAPPSQSRPPAADRTPATVTPAPAPVGKDGIPDFKTLGEQIGALQKSSDAKIDGVARIPGQIGTSVQDAALAVVQQLKADARRLRWTLRRVKAARFIWVLIRVLLGVATFLALYLLLLFFHHPVAEYAQSLMKGSLGSFALLAALLLPIELIKAFIEPRVHRWFHAWEHARTEKEFDTLLHLLGRVRIAIAEANV